jgi:hypothetical protein
MEKRIKAIRSQKCEPAKVTNTDKKAITRLASEELIVMIAPRTGPRV